MKADAKQQMDAIAVDIEAAKGKVSHHRYVSTSHNITIPRHDFMVGFIKGGLSKCLQKNGFEISGITKP
jgi:hypothetical protein